MGDACGAGRERKEGLLSPQIAEHREMSKGMTARLTAFFPSASLKSSDEATSKRKGNQSSQHTSNCCGCTDPLATIEQISWHHQQARPFTFSRKIWRNKSIRQYLQGIPFSLRLFCLRSQLADQRLGLQLDHDCLLPTMLLVKRLPDHCILRRPAPGHMPRSADYMKNSHLAYSTLKHGRSAWMKFAYTASSLMPRRRHQVGLSGSHLNMAVLTSAATLLKGI